MNQIAAAEVAPHVEDEGPGDAAEATDNLPEIANVDATDTGDNPPAFSIEVFSMFPKLPPEIRQEIWRAAMLWPGIEYFKLTPEDLAQPGGGLITARPSRRGVVPVSEQWFELEQVNDEAKAIVELASKRPDGRRPFEAYSRINQDRTLVVVHLPKGAATAEEWVDAHIEADPDLVYENIGRSLKRVGIWWQLKSQRCNGAGHGPGGESPWAPASFVLGSHCLSGMPCRELMVRYIPFFRDADVLYFLVYLDGKGIQGHIRDSAKSTNVSPCHYLSDIIVGNAKRQQLESWQDYHNIWYEVAHNWAYALLTSSGAVPWHMVEYLRSHLDRLDPAEKAKVNPNMEFKVLVTSHHMRRQ